MTDCESLEELWSICEEVARFEDDRPLREANCSDRNGKVIALQALAQKLIRARSTTKPPATTDTHAPDCTGDDKGADPDCAKCVADNQTTEATTDESTCTTWDAIRAKAGT